jgi:pyrroloquinoline quinone (PQQ) biosynthesis protein C
MTEPPLPPVAASVDTWPPWLTRGCVRSTQATSHRLAAIAGKADVKKRAKFIPSYPKEARRTETFI